jgi:glycosyltransferase involved in cell wall biosynthesis
MFILEGLTMPIVVSICTITYNHALYIRQCLDGFLMQKTNFPIEVLIHDDASTDGTADIIREYEQKCSEIIKPIYQIENQHSKNVKISMTYNWPRAQGKYIALCEGDDYWIDPYKLQKQVDFLEKNPEYGMCYTKVKVYIQQQKRYSKRVFGGNATAFDDLINANAIPTLTVCLRKDLLLQYCREIKPESRNWLMGDYPTWLWFAYNSKIYFSDEITGVYRVLKESMSHSGDIEKRKQFFISSMEIRRYFLNLYSGDTLNINFSNIEKKELAGFAVKEGDYDSYKANIIMIKKKTLKILIKKIIGKNRLFFIIYRFYLSITGKILI